MSDAVVKILRSLRSDAQKLSTSVATELSAFLNDDKLTFLRTADSLRNAKDVNVTTTCSCLMALALTDQFPSAYGEKWKLRAQEAFDKLIRAPWMSSGLTENNAFTTALVIRTLGFLTERNIVASTESQVPGRKRWHLRLGVKEIAPLIAKLKERDHPLWGFFWRSISDKCQAAILKWRADSKDPDDRLLRLVTLNLQRVIEGTWIYSTERFPKLSPEIQAKLDIALTEYERADLNRLLLVANYPDIFESPELSLSDIAAEMASPSASETTFTINEYPPSAAVIYWFVDGVTRSQISLPAKKWCALCRWAVDEFNHQRSLVTAHHDAMMDPVAMAMAACLCRCLQSKTAELGCAKEDRDILPSRVELEDSITLLFREQTDGIWPKYFPLFHYQEAGSNFCFTFELLEAILVEFGGDESALLENEPFLKGLADSLAWCVDNRLPFAPEPTILAGWNSGGSIETLKKNQPESWATAVVHMFLWQLCEVTSARIQRLLLGNYNARRPKASKALTGLIDIKIWQKGVPDSLKEVLIREIISEHLGKTSDMLRRHHSKATRSALLFGPPGTSKTNITEAVAYALEWPLIQIDPSHFLREGLDQIYIQANKLFEDLMDLTGVVVLFDEIDALVQTRDSSFRLDTAAQFLTTFMLPKLAKLHAAGRVIYFMATNFQERFDAAIKRPGRFDLLLCMGPPALASKLRNLHKFIGEEPSQVNIISAWLIRAFVCQHPDIKTQLDLYTFSEFKTLLLQIGANSAELAAALNKMSPEAFRELVANDSQFVYLKLRDLWPLAQLRVVIPDTIAGLRKIKISREELERADIEITPVIRYLLDLKESRASVPD